MQWMPFVQNDGVSDICIRSSYNIVIIYNSFNVLFFKGVQDAYIRCPHGGYMEFILPAGHRNMFVRIPKPDTNVDWNK